jgi:hypothetical protein
MRGATPPGNVEHRGVEAKGRQLEHTEGSETAASENLL